MGSFTDAIHKFNPYIQQLPVDEMVKVGMYKQEQYDKGVEKIQSYIDNIAGMDVVRDVDKQYLQSKLNELGSNLKKVAGGDFSNHQLVNSVGGMAKQIIRDEGVQTAVNSTAWYRKQQAEMEKAIQEGKSGESNIWDFQQKSSQWLNDQKAGQAFNGRYTQYRDVKKTAMEAIKALHPNLQKYDIPYLTDKNGNLDPSQIATVMKRMKVEGIDEQDIKKAIEASMTPDDYNQLSIDGRYRFKDVDSESLKKSAMQTYEQSKASATQALALLESRKRTNSNPSEDGVIDERIAYYKSKLEGGLDEELKEQLIEADKNPDGVKTAIYKNGFVKQFADAFSWKTEEMEYVKSPFQEQQNWAAEMKQKQIEYDRKVWEFGQTYQQKERELAAKHEDKLAEAMLKAQEAGIDPKTGKKIGISLGGDTDNVLKAGEYFKNQTNALSSDIASIKKEILASGSILTEADLNGAANDLLNNPQKLNRVKAEVLGLLRDYNKKSTYLGAMMQYDKTVRAQAENDPTVAAERKKLLVDLKTLPTIKVGNQQFTQQELLDYTNKTKNIVNKENFDDSNLTPKEKLLFNTISGDSFVQRKYRNISNDYVNTKNIIEKKYNELMAPRVAKLRPELVAVASDEKTGAIPTSKLDNINLLIARQIQMGLKSDANFNPETTSDFFSEAKKKDTRVFVYRQGDNYQLQIKNQSKPNDIQTITVNKKDVSDFIGNEYVDDTMEDALRLQMGNNNTNISGTPKRAFMQKSFGDFPGITKYTITGDLVGDRQSPDLYVPNVNIKKKDGRYANFPIPGINRMQRVGFEQGKKQLNSLTDDQLITLLKAQYPTFDFSTLDVN
jgi:hypothetical protein